MLYIDDGAFIFNTREEATRGVALIKEVFARFGLEMHVGEGEKMSKTEMMYVPPPSFYQNGPLQTPELPRTTSPAEDTVNDDNEAV